MHMSDALLSPSIGGVFWVASAGFLALAVRRCKDRAEDAAVPMMGVLSAFVFAAQMITFALPGTGSSGHLGGGMLLAIVLGPHRAFLAMTAILAMQSLLFADGGLMALGANLFNLGVIPCYVAYPLLWKPMANRWRNHGEQGTVGRIGLATYIATPLAFIAGATMLVLQTTLSGISDLPPHSLALFLLPVQGMLGIIEGLVTAGILHFILRARPGLVAL